MAQTLSDWLERISNLHSKEIDLTLDRSREVFNSLYPNGLDVPVVTVAGTNGKGSTVAYLDSLCRASGLKPLTFTSPHLYSYRERLTFNDEWLSEAQHIEAFNAIETAAEDTELTFFEISTLSAFYWCDVLQPDVLILEVGLGGRLDATNLVDANVAVITTVDFDHQEYLGDTLEAIATEKLGVIKDSTVAILADKTVPTQCLLDLRCKQLIKAGVDYSFVDGQVTLDEHYALPSQIQPESNAAAALVAFDALFNNRLNPEINHRGNELLNLKGRFQIINEKPLTILDVAHNPQAIAHLVKHLQSKELTDIHAIIGMMHDKNIAEVFTSLSEVVCKWNFCALDSPRAATVQQLETIAINGGISQKDISCYSSPIAAYEAVMPELQEDCDTLIVIGSFLTVGPIIERINN